jgi:hypothetical protein
MTTQILPTLPTVSVPNLKQNVQKSNQTITPLSRDQIIDTIADILEEMIADRCDNFSSYEEIPSPNMFHAKKLPSISIRNYLKRFAQFSECQDYIFVILLVFLDRLGEKVESFSLDTFNAHRFLLLTLVMAIKSHEDKYYKNSYYAKIGGITKEEMKALEQEYLFNYIQFNLYVDTDTYNSYYQDLIDYNQDKLAEKEAL